MTKPTEQITAQRAEIDRLREEIHGAINDLLAEIPDTGLIRFRLRTAFAESMKNFGPESETKP